MFFLLLNYYTLFSLLALIGSVIVIALIARDALFKRRVVRAGLTAVFVTPFVIALVYLWTTWSWTTWILSSDFHTEATLYGSRPVILIHLAADLARAFLLVPWFPSGVVGAIVGIGCGTLTGIGRGWRAQATTGVTPARFPRRTLLLGGTAALGVLALPGVVFTVFRIRGQAGTFSSASSHTPTPVSTFSPPPRLVNSVALSPDGSRVAFGGSNGLLQVWDVRHQKLLFTRRSQTGLIESVGWSPDGKSIASSGGKILTIWDARSGVLLTTYTVSGPGVDLFPLAWSPDGKSIAASNYWGGRLHVWRVADATLLYTCDGTSASWSPDGRYLVTGSGPDSPLVAWVRDAHTGNLLFTYRGLSQGVASGGANFSDILAWSPDSQRVALGVADTVHIWDALDGGHLKQYQVPNLDALIWLPGGGLIVTGDNSGGVKSWNIADGHTIHVYRQVDMNVASRVWALTCTPDGKYIAAGFLENIVQVWETQSGKQLFQFKAKS
jgi:WD domain, G-beta repeat